MAVDAALLRALAWVTGMKADATTETDPIIDRTAVFERFEGDVALMREIADLLLATLTAPADRKK